MIFISTPYETCLVNSRPMSAILNQQYLILSIQEFMHIMFIKFNMEHFFPTFFKHTCFKFPNIKNPVQYLSHLLIPPYMYTCRDIGVQDHFCSGGLRSLARIFSPSLAQNSSGFARILFAFCPKMAIRIFLGGLQPPNPPALYAYV